jgi:hypothetical protein
MVRASTSSTAWPSECSRVGPLVVVLEVKGVGGFQRVGRHRPVQRDDTRAARPHDLTHLGGPQPGALRESKAMGQRPNT